MLRSLTKIRTILLSLVFSVVLASAMVPAATYAAPTEGNEEGGSSTASSDAGTDLCEGATQRCNHFINTYVNPFIYLLSALVGVVAVISIIMAGVQYASSADDPSTVSKAKTRIFNTVIGLVAYIFLFAFFEYLVPGGIF